MLRMLQRLAARTAAAVAGGAALALAAGALAAPVTVVEYYNAALDHYFMSPLAADIDALDSGRIAGWSRTGHNFLAFGVAGIDFPAGSPVCRYYIPPEHGDSHFFSASPAECAAVQARIGTDPNYSGYILETPAAFFAPLPDLTTGACAAGLVPVYRLWNMRADSNHRYTTDPDVRAAMIARGYAPEGYGPLGVAMCSPGPLQGDARITVSSLSAYPAGCDATSTAGAFINAEVEPMLAVNPLDPANVIGTWQQDRWADGGARGLRTAYSHDGGRTFALAQASFSHCSGGNAGNGGDYARASDPWVSIGPTGIAYQIAIAFTGGTFAPNSINAVLASRSLDGGATWSAPATLMRDGSGAFNDKESITADTTNGNLAYAAWDRLLPNGSGPTWLARTVDGGATWEPARAIYAPGGNGQTLNNQIVVLPDGTLVLFFTELITVNHVTSATLRVARSVDKGITFGAPVTIAQSLSIGTQDPQTGQPIRDAGNIGSIAVGRNGVLAVAWQDARFSGGTVEGIAFSRSADGGMTWTPPVGINHVPGAQALIPAVAIRDDGTYGVLYDDLRNDTADPTTLFADTWLTQSSDGVTWTESHVSGPFDLDFAPRVQEGSEIGLFVGDYQALRASGAQFLPFFVQTTRDTANRTDVYESIVGTVPPPAVVGKGDTTRRYAARPAHSVVSSALTARAAAAAARTLARRRIDAIDHHMAAP
ncbi:MAG TPA: sialidase family protein [Casimicrobiaceae bacterium]|nr:sialidase family protein [Casimicrobiaceae bacterium]